MKTVIHLAGTERIFQAQVKMKFPVDLLANVDPGALELSAKDYMSKLLYRSPEIQESLRLPDSKQIDIGLCNVSFVPLYGHDTEHKILALYSPDDIHTAVGLYLLGQWWSAEDILKTADPSRTGLLEVRTPGERIVLYVLNRIIYRTKEIASNDVPFLCHEKHEIAKIFWKDGEAIGFYSFKPEGTLCNSFVTQCYQLPVMDTVFIRKCHRGHGHGVQMLEDFVRTFRNSCVGLRYPLPTAMYKVCKNYLRTHPADKELLWEVQGVGGPYQRTMIFKKLQTMELKGDHQVAGKLNFETENTDVPVEKITPAQMRMEYTVVEVMEEEVQVKITKEVQDTPVTTLGRSSSLKRKKLGEDTGATTEKMIRVEDIEARVPSPVHEPMPEAVRSSLIVKETDLKDTTNTVTPNEATAHVHCQQQKEQTTESEQYVLEVCALTKPSADIVTPEEALDKTELLQITPVTEIQSMKSNEETQIVKSVEATIGATDLQPLELQQLVEVNIVKMTLETEVIKEKTDSTREVKSTNHDINEGEDEISEEISAVDEAAKLICEGASDPKLSQQTELDLKPVTMGSENCSATDVRILTRSSRVSTAAHQQNSTHIHQASKPCSSKAKATTEHKSLQSSKAVQQNESGQAVDKPANVENLEMRRQVWMEKKVVDIVADANEACLSLSENIEETYVMKEDVLKEKDHVQSPEHAVQQGENIEISGEKMIVEEISQDGSETQKDSEIEKREETSADFVEENETTEELSQPNQAICEKTEESKTESSEAKNEAGEKEHTEQEPMNDTSVVHIQVLSHDADNAIKSNWTEPAEEEDSDKAGSSGKHAGSRRSNYGTPSRCSGRFKDQSEEGELTGRVLRSGTKSVTAISKQSHVRHTKTVTQQEKSDQAEDESEKERGTETVGITSVEVHTILQDSLETESAARKNFKEVKHGSLNETTGDVVEQSDVELIEKQEKEPDTKMLQKDGKNIVVLHRETGENVVIMETLQSQEDKDEELAHLASKEKDREERQEDEEVKQTEPLVEPAEEEQGGNETSAEMLQSVEEDVLIKASVAEGENELAVLGAEEAMINVEKQVAEESAENMLRTDHDQEERMSVEEKLRGDKVGDITLEEESVAAELHTSEEERKQKEVQESVTPNSEVTVQESSPKEDTSGITSRSLRQRTVTVKCPPQRKSKRFQKAEMEIAEDENVVMVEVIDKTDKSRVEETEENKNEKMETEDGAALKDEGRVSESADTEQGVMEVMQEEEPLKETQTVQEIQGKEETEIEDVSEPSHGHIEEKSDNWTEPVEEEDSDKTDSSRKHAGNRRSNYGTPSRRSGRFQDQSEEGELTGRVLRSGTKSVTVISKQRHVRHTKTVKQQEKCAQGGDESEKEEGKEMVGITSVEFHTNLQDSVEEENRMEKEYSETELAAGKDFKEMKNGSLNETTGDVTKITIVGLDAEIVNEGETQVEGKTAVQTDVERINEQEKEPAPEMAQKDGHNLVVPHKETDENLVVKKTLQSQEDKDEELAQLASKEKDREERQEDEEVKQTEPLVEPAEEEQEGGNETSAEMLQSVEEDVLIKASVAEGENELAVLGAEEAMINVEKQVAEESAENMLRTDQDQEERMSVEEKLRGDKVGDITLEEESVAAELHTSEEERKQKEVQESVTPNSEVTVQESSPKEDTPVITSRSLRQRMVTVKCPPQRKSKRFQKAEMEIAEDENVVMVEVIDKTDKSRVEETEENKNEKMETEDGAALKDEGRVSESADTEQGVMEVMQEEESLKETQTVQEIQGKEETEIEDVSEPSHGHIEEKSDNWTEPVEEEDSDKTDSSGKPAGNRRSNYGTPSRRSGRFQDQSEEGELTGRVLRSGTKSVTAISKQRHVRHTKTVKQQEKSAQGGDESKAEQMDGVTESHTGAVEGEKNETVGISCEGENENVIDLQDSAVEHSNVEKEYVEPDTTHDNDGSQSETTCDGKKITVMDEAEVVKETEPEGEGKMTKSLAGPVTKGGNETTKPQEEDELNKASVGETGFKEPMTESLKEQAMEPGLDNLLKDREQGEVMQTKEKDDEVGETSLNKESTTLVCTSESEKSKDDQEILKPDHGETAQEGIPEEETPVITSRRRRTVTVKSPPQRKSKCLQKTEVEMTENENVRMIDVMMEESICKDSTAETDQNKDEKSCLGQEVSSISNDGGQMEVVHEEETVKESSTHQEIIENEAIMYKEVSQLGQADKTAVTDIHLAEVVKDVEIEEECNTQEELAAAPVEEHELVTEMAHGPDVQKAEETAAVLLQKSSVVLVDFNNAPPKQTAAGGTSKETARVSLEPDKPASTSRSVEEITSNKDMLNETEAWVVPVGKEQTDEEDVVEIAENENLGMDDGKVNIFKGTSKGKDEKMETEEDVVREDEYIVQGKEPGKTLSTVQGIQGDEEKETTDIQEATRVGEDEKPDTQKSSTQIELVEVENLRKRGKPRSTGKQTERSAVGTPVRRSRQFTELPTTSEVTTRVLRSSTKQVQTTPNQRNIQPTKVMVQKERSDQAVAKEDNTQTVRVITERTAVLPDIELREEDSHPRDEEMEVDIRTELFPEQGKFTTDVVLNKATAATVDETDTVKDVEIEVEGRAAVQSMAETAKEQGEALVTEIAQKEDGQNPDESLTALTLQKAAVVLVDFNKVPPKQTIGIETPEETILIRNIDEYRKQSNEECRQDKSLVESAEKEQVSGIETSTKTTQSQEQDVLNKADVLEEQQILVEVGVEKAITQNLENQVAEVGEELMLKTDREQEKGMLTEETLKDDKVAEVTFEAESTATEADRMVAVSTRKSEGNQKEELESLTPDPRESVQESSPEEETPVITSRSLRQKIVTVSSSPQRKYRRLAKPEVQADVDKVESVKTTDVKVVEKPLLLCVPMEVEMPEKKAETSNEVGNETLEIERQECILGEHEMQVLIFEDNSQTELEMLQEIADKGDAAMEESDDKENEAMASDRSVIVEVESTPTEEQKVSVVKTSEVEREESSESRDVGLILHVQDNTELGIQSGSLANLVEEAVSQTEERVERDNAQNTGCCSTKPAYEENSDEEESIITKNLRQRTVTVESPMRRKSKRLCREVVETQKAQSRKKALLVVASSQRETTESIEETSRAVEIKITEPHSKDECKDAQMACEGMSKEVTALEKQDGKNIAVIVVETVETKTDGGKDMVDGAPEKKVEESTAMSGVHDKVEVKDIIYSNLQEKVADAIPEQDSVQQENLVLDKAEELRLEERSEGESKVVEEGKQLEMLAEMEEGVEVTERRLLRKRTITNKATIERKSKRMCKQDVEHAESPLSEEEPVMEQRSTAEKETTRQKDPKTVDDRDKDGDHENLDGEETCGETNTSTEEQEVGKEMAQFINMSVKELRAKTETWKGEKSEEKDEDTEATIADTVEKIMDQDQEEKEQNSPKEYSEISLAPYESFTLELDEEDENNGPKESSMVEEIEVSLMECPRSASTTIQTTDKCEEHITEEVEEPAVKKVPAGRSSATASPEQVSARRHKRFLQENELGGKSERKTAKEVIKEQKEKDQQKRKAIPDTPRRSKRLATPKKV
ncbi:uncharacterized protein [Salminus brasiliensis]|uniref:uncharacterized protein n=1 Tax=Salminus brasiliensis TaxID=930266 RepID=UPI003B8399C7